MSYILDALRKADAERDRGNVPGIHAQPSFGGAAPARAQAAATPWGWLAAGALALLLVGALAWYLIGPARAPSVVAVAPAPAPTPITAAPPPAAMAPAPAPVAAPTAVPPAPIARPAPAPAPEPAARKPKAAATPTLAPTTAPAQSPAQTANPAPAPTAPSGDTAPAAKPAATGDRVYTVAELPDDIRRQLPAVSVGGSMYSPKAADRILIINGQVLHEGDTIAADLILQQIRVKAAVLNFKGYRYTVTF